MTFSSKVFLEVERKFCGLAVPFLTLTAGEPGFWSLHRLSDLVFTDIYYDRCRVLSSKGVWLRKRQISGRSPAWEAKCSQGGTFNNSMFEELSDAAAISKRIELITGQPSSSENDFGMSGIAELTTRRETYIADEKFKIVLDRMDFGHEVGEVELTHDLDLADRPSPKASIEEWKQTVTFEMDAQIEAFMKRYHWAFKPGIPKGKLTAYFERQQSKARSHAYL